MIENLSDTELSAVAGGALTLTHVIYGKGGHYDVYTDNCGNMVAVWHAD